MTSNAKPIGSANIVSFGFLATFDLDQKKLIFDIQNQTVFTTNGAANVLGVSFNVMGPGGLILMTADFNAPAIVPASSSTFALNLPAPFNLFGWFSIEGLIKDQNGTIYSTGIIRKEICKPEGYDTRLGYVLGKMLIDLNLDAPTLTVIEETNLTYKGFAPVNTTKSGTLTYPAATLSPLSFSNTPLVLTQGSVFTGRYTVNNKTSATYDLNDGIEILIPYVTSQLEKVVIWGSSLGQILCSAEDVYKIFKRNPASASGKSAKEKLDRVSLPIWQAIVKEKSGQSADEEIAEIKEILGCECGPSNLIEGIPVQGNGGASVSFINIIGNNAAAVTASTSGGTKTYSINTKFTQVTQVSPDANFSITRSESSSAITYALAFNYPALAQQLLTSIQNDQQLSDFLNSLITAATSNVSLTGYNGKCVVTVGNCSYSLTVPATPSKIISSITIGGTVYNAPTGLNITDDTNIASWLNGLSLGAFTANYDSNSGNTIIGSLNNPNNITQLIYSQGGSAVTKQFTKTCLGLVDILNAITTYICALDTTQMILGVTGLSVNGFKPDGSISTTALSAPMSLDSVISAILTAQSALFTKLSQVALTCPNVKTLFTPSIAAFDPIQDYLLGTKSGACAQVTMADIAAGVLAAIAASPALKAQNCALSTGCAAPVVKAPTNLGAVYVSGNTCAPVTDITGTVSA